MLGRRVTVRHGLWQWVEQLEEGCLCSLKVGNMLDIITGLATCSELKTCFYAVALMNFAGSAFMLQGRMNYEQMLQVYNLILFSLTFGSGLLDFSKYTL